MEDAQKLERIARLQAGAVADVAGQWNRVGKIAPLVAAIQGALSSQEVARIRWLVRRLAAEL